MRLLSTAGTLPTPPRVGLGVAFGLLAAVQLLAVNYWPRFPSPNERPRAYQALAVVHRGVLDIEPELGRWGSSEDLAAHGGRTYPNKAPGVLPLLLPGALVAHLLAPCGSEGELEWALVLGRVLASTLPSWVAIWLLWRRPDGGPLLAAVWALATPALAASLLLFSHALAACLLLGALTLLERRSWRGDVGAGVALGWACSCEYPLVVPALVLVLAMSRRPVWSRWGAVAAGAAIPAVLLAAYNQACFGSAWSLSSAHEMHHGFAALAGSGVFGIGLPGVRGLGGLLLSPERGLAVWAPVVLVAAAGLGRLPAARWHTLAPAGLAFLSLLILMAGYRNWHGGWFPGPRYVLAALPLGLVALAPALAALAARPVGRIAAAAALLCGVAINSLAVASFPFPPEDAPLPALTLAPALLADGITFPSWGGPVLWLGALAAAALFAGWALARGLAQTRAELLLAFGLALVALATSRAAVSWPVGWQGRLELAVLRDVYGDGRPRGALVRLRAECSSPEQCAQVDAWLRELRRAAAKVP